jgi:ABC-type antimicrobial peptide transport system permease subunit
MVYMDYMQLPKGSMLGQVFSFASEFAIRSTLPQAALDKELRAATKQVAPDMTEMNLQPMEEAIANSLSERRLVLRLVTGFGGVALVLAAIGLYGVLAYSVAQRRSEIGIRMALGSSRAGVIRLVAQQAGLMTLCGLVLGTAGTWPAARAVKSFLFGVKPLDPWTLAAATAILLLVCAAAAVVPAWRAARVDPMEALRAE